MRPLLRSYAKRLAIAAATLASAGVVWGQEAGNLDITALASAVLPTVVDQSIQFGLLEVTVAAGESARYAVPEGMLFQVAGSQIVAWDGGSVTLDAGDGAHLGAGFEATFSAGPDADAVFLHFLLLLGREADLPVVTGATRVVEVYRSEIPLPGLEVGAYAFDLTLLEFGPRYPVNDPHYRTGGALYYVVSGAGVFTAEGVAQRMPAGSAILEPFALVHRWANPYDEVVIVVLANISPKGEPAVAFVDEE